MRTTAEWLAASRRTGDRAALVAAEAAAEHPEDWLRIAEHLCAEGQDDRARAALARAVELSLGRHRVNPLALYRSTDLLAKRLGDHEAAREVLRRFELALVSDRGHQQWGYLATAHQALLGDAESAVRCLGEAERRADTPERLAALSGFFVELGLPREQACALLERAEAFHPPALVGRALWSLMLAWRALGEAPRARSLLERVTEEAELVEVLLGAARAWWTFQVDEDGVRRALARAEPRTTGASAWLALAEAFRDGGDGERLETWDPDGVRRCLERAIASEPSADERTAIAAGFRRWLGDEDRARGVVPSASREPRARVRPRVGAWGTGQPLELFELLRDRLAPDDLEHLAVAQCHQDVARHRLGLEELLHARLPELPLQSHPFHALEAASWETGERTNHRARAFACTLLLLDGERVRASDTIAPLVESSWELGLVEALERFLAWLAEVLSANDVGWAVLALALSTARRDPNSTALVPLVDSLSALTTSHTNGCVDPDWVYPAEHGLRRAVWAALVEEALGSASGTEVERLRALLRARHGASGPAPRTPKRPPRGR